jgi:hypothetical protein
LTNYGQLSSAKNIKVEIEVEKNKYVESVSLESWNIDEIEPGKTISNTITITITSEWRKASEDKQVKIDVRAMIRDASGIEPTDDWRDVETVVNYGECRSKWQMILDWIDKHADILQLIKDISSIAIVDWLLKLFGVDVGKRLSSWMQMQGKRLSSWTQMHHSGKKPHSSNTSTAKIDKSVYPPKATQLPKSSDSVKKM